jgi:hypothetical protein
MDAIRSITLDDSWDDWRRKVSRTRGVYHFKGKPQRLEVGDLLFFSYDFRVRAFATVQRISCDEQREKPWLVSVGPFTTIQSTKYYKGFAQLRYLDRLGKQYDGEYRLLANELNKIAKRVRGE